MITLEKNTIEQINSVFPPEYRERVSHILVKSNLQSKEKKILKIRSTRKLIKIIKKIRILVKYGLHFNKPRYMFRILINIIEQNINNLFNITTFKLKGCEFDITFACNFKCQHCSIARLSQKTRGKELSVSEYRNIVRQAEKLGAQSFGLEGGEPFVRKDWDQIILALRPKSNHIIITTNGYLFNEEKAALCKKIGVDTINISIDNGEAELHDLFRHKNGAFKKAMDAIKHCKKYKLKVIINTVVHKFNLYTDGLLKILEFGEENRILVHLLFAKAIGNFQDSQNFLLTEKDVDAFYKIIKPYACAFVHHNTNASIGRKGCNGTKEMLQFTPYGDVMNCANMHIFFGNVREKSLKEIREAALTDTPFNTYSPCFLSENKTFMDIYHSLLKEQPYISLSEFKEKYKELQRTNS